MADTPSKLPAFVTWPSFPFEGQLRAKRLDPPVAEEPPREGEDPSTCMACSAPDDVYVWVSDRWRVRAMDRPSGLPMVLILESRSHLDLGDLTNLLAAELGVMTVRLERAIRSLDGVERVHVNRWGDGAAHLHLWFLARPTGQLQLRGSFLSLWDDIIEPIPEHLWRENLADVAAWLADFGGRAVAEPPRIVWHAPSNFAEVETAESNPSVTLETTAASTDGAAADGVSADGVSADGATANGGRSAATSGGQAGGARSAGTSAARGDIDGIVVAGVENGAGGNNGGPATGDRKQVGEKKATGDAATAPAAIAARPVPVKDFDGPDGLGGEGWMLSAEDVDASDILAR